MFYWNGIRGMSIAITFPMTTKRWNVFCMKWISWAGMRNKIVGALSKQALRITHKNSHSMHTYSKRIMTTGKTQSGIRLPTL